MEQEIFRIIVEQLPTEQAKVHNNSISNWRSGFKKFDNIEIAKKMKEYMDLLPIKALDVYYKGDPIYGSDAKLTKYNFIDVTYDPLKICHQGSKAHLFIEKKYKVRIPISETEYWSIELFDKTKNLLKDSTYSQTTYFKEGSDLYYEHHDLMEHEPFYAEEGNFMYRDMHMQRLNEYL